MTTFEPGARLVFTHGLVVSPRSTAFLASSPAATITDGLDVLVQLVMAAMTTWPWSRSKVVPSSSVTGTGELGGASAALSPPRTLATAVRYPSRAWSSGTRSWGRAGPASDGTTVDRSSVSVSEYAGW